MTAATSEPTKAADTPPVLRALLPAWIAYAAAGLTFVAAAYLWTSISAFLAIYEGLGVPVPALVYFQLAYPNLLPLGMVLTGLATLLATRPVGLARHRAARSLSFAGAVFLILFSVLMVIMNAITVRGLQEGTQDRERLDQSHVEQKLAWARKLPPTQARPTWPAKFAPVKFPVSIAGKGEPLQRAFDRLAAAARVRIRLAHTLRSRPCNSPMVDVPWEAALTALLRTNDAQPHWISQQDLVVVPTGGREVIVSDVYDERLSAALKRLGGEVTPPAGHDPVVRFECAFAPRREVIEVLAVLAGCRVEEGRGGALRLVPQK